MRLTVLSVAYPFAPVGPRAVGGAERILTDLDCALTASGHTSVVIACEGSVTAGRLVSIPLPASGFDAPQRTATERRVQAAIDRMVAECAVDLIHMHGFDFHRYRLPEGVPVLVTLHLPVAWYPAEIWQRLAGRAQVQFVSDSQRRSAPAELRDAPVIPNGVALQPWRERAKADYALAMGRICPEKNQRAALEAGALAGVPVLLAGQVFPYAEHLAYFRDEVEPLLKPPHRFVGPVYGARKAHLLARARCLAHPTLAPETSSLVALEALAAGTPVVAYRSGALRDIVEDGINGFMVDDVFDMAEAIGRAGEISPAQCRRTAERFSLDSMIDGYLRLYEECCRAPKHD